MCAARTCREVSIDECCWPWTTKAFLTQFLLKGSQLDFQKIRKVLLDEKRVFIMLKVVTRRAGNNGSCHVSPEDKSSGAYPGFQSGVSNIVHQSKYDREGVGVGGRG